MPQYFLYAVSLALSAATALVTLHVRAELADTRAAIIEKVEAVREQTHQNFPHRREFETLQERVKTLEERPLNARTQ